MFLENWRVAPYFPPAYYLAMSGESFRDRVLEVMAKRAMNKAELSRLSGVPYHAIDKFLKRPGATTKHENAVAMARALGIKMDGEAEYEELRQLFFQLDEETQKFAIATLRGLVRQK